jgi:hypothetical protein
MAVKIGDIEIGASEHKVQVLYCNVLKAKPPTQKSPAHSVGLLRQR